MQVEKPPAKSHEVPPTPPADKANPDSESHPFGQGQNERTITQDEQDRMGNSEAFNTPPEPKPH